MSQLVNQLSRQVVTQLICQTDRQTYRWTDRPSVSHLTGDKAIHLSDGLINHIPAPTLEHQTNQIFYS